MALFRKGKNGGLMDAIRCDEPSYLIWKWHPPGAEKGKNNRENAIRWGSLLRVKDGEVAVFVYNQNNGIYEDFIEGPFDKFIITENLPVLANILGAAYDGETPFPAEIYFINLARIIQTKFAVPFFDVFDPRFNDFSVPVAVRGTISFRIANYIEFIKLHRLESFNLDTFEKQIRDATTRYVKDIILNTPSAHNIPVIQIETKTGIINDTLEYNLRQRLEEDFGVKISGVDISAIDIDKTSDGYHQLMRITQNVTTATIEAQTAANVKNIYDRQQVEIRDYDENLRIRREENQYAKHKETQSSNIQAFQIEKQAEVGVAGANALGQMGADGAGDINLGDGGGGFNPMSLMAGMAVGGAIGQNIAGAMNGMISGIASPQTGEVPPPIPTSVYYLAVDGKATGPFDVQTLSSMISSGQMKQDSLVWQKGMSSWKRAEQVIELNKLFEAETPPPIPE